jgi:hypothetical protein
MLTPGSTTAYAASVLISRIWSMPYMSSTMPPALGITDGSSVPLQIGVTGTTSLSAIFSTTCTSATDMGRTTMSGIVFGIGRAVPE